MQKYRPSPLSIEQSETPEIETMERPDVSGLLQKGGPTTLEHGCIELPSGEVVCGVCGRLWPCDGDGSFAVVR